MNKQKKKKKRKKDLVSIETESFNKKPRKKWIKAKLINRNMWKLKLGYADKVKTLLLLINDNP